MITVPKITLPPSSVIWNSKAATLSPPSCRAASIAAASRIAVMAIGADDARRVGAGRHDPERMDEAVEAKARTATVSIIFLTQRPMTNATASQTRAPSTRGMASAILLSMLVAGSEMAEICRICSAPMAAKMMMIAETVIPTALAIELRAGAVPSWRHAALVDGQRCLADADPGAAEQPLEVERAEHCLDDMADDPGQDQPGEEEQAGAQQARQEGEHLVGQRGHRRQHARQAERLQRRDQPDQPHQPIGQPAELGPDDFAAAPRMALEDRHPVDAAWPRPIAPPWRRNG